MKTEKKIHKGYVEFKEMKKMYGDYPQIIGKYHYIFSNSRGKISLIKQIRRHVGLGIFWEIYCLDGNLFEDTERFSTKEKAIEKVKEYLGVDELSELIEEKLEMIEREVKNNEKAIN